VWPTSGYVSRLSEQLANYHSKHGVLCFLNCRLDKCVLDCWMPGYDITMDLFLDRITMDLFNQE
jgi:hypothetical protein